MDASKWHHCSFCGEPYHENSGHYVPTRGISACEYCVKAGRLEPLPKVGGTDA